MKRKNINKIIKSILISLLFILPITVLAEDAKQGDLRYEIQTIGSTTNEGDVELKKTVTKTDKIDEFLVTLTTKGKKVTTTETITKPVYAVVVFDKSASMCTSLFCGPILGYGSKWDNAVRGAKIFSNKLLEKIPNSQIALVTFSDSASISNNFANSNLDNADFNYPDGGTNIISGLEQAKQLLSSNVIPDNANKYIVLIGDGQPTYGKSTGDGSYSNQTMIDETVATATNIKNNNIEIFSIGYQTDTTAQETLKKVATDDSHYVDSNPEAIAQSFTDIANKISYLDAGTNAVITDTISNDFTFVEGSSSNAIANGKVVTCSIGNITEEEKTCSFKVKINYDENSTGWHSTNSTLNNGVNISYINSNGTLMTDSITSSSEVYCEKNKYNYKVEYYQDDYNNKIFTSDNFEEVYGTTITNSIISADLGSNWLNLKKKNGYKNGIVQEYIIVGSTDNVIKVLYTKDSFNYKINYYKDSVSESNYLNKVEGNEEFESIIEIEELKYLPRGYKYTDGDKTITIDTENNEMNIVYVKDESQKHNITYIVKHYIDGEYQSNDDVTETKSVWINDTSIPVTYELNNNKYIGYKYLSDNLTETATNNQAFEVRYVKDESQKHNITYIVKHYIDGEYQSKDDITETKSVWINDTSIAVTYELNNNKYIGYKYLSDNLTETATNNQAFEVYYVKDSFNYTINYYYDGILDETKTEILEALYGTIIEKVPDKSYGDYKLFDLENLPLTIDVEHNIINVKYITMGIGGHEELPPQTGNNNNIIVMLILSFMLIVKFKLKNI